jgi:HSP20 family protein
MDFFKKLTGLNNHKVNVNASPAVETASVQPEEQWLADDYEEGQLAIDVYQTKDAIIVKSTIAGVKPEDIDIAINNDLLTIRGTRKMEEQINGEDYYYQECYWGGFSRSIILPVEVKSDQIEATIENGVLTVILPKAQTAKQISVKVKE